MGRLSTSKERSPIPAAKPLSVKARIGAAALVLVAGYGTYFSRDFIRDELHDPSPPEQTIERVLEDAYDTDVRKVRCLNDDQMAAQRNPFGPWPRRKPNHGSVPYVPLPKKEWKFFLPYVRLNDDVCKKLIAFIQQPPQEVWEVDNELTPALQTAAHEMEHIAQIRDEPRADCRAIQTIHELAIVMGASTDAALQIQERNTRFIKSRKSADHLQQCYPGGPYDLGLGQALYFPYGPPGAPDRDKSVQATP